MISLAKEYGMEKNVHRLEDIRKVMQPLYDESGRNLKRSTEFFVKYMKWDGSEKERDNFFNYNEEWEKIRERNLLLYAEIRKIQTQYEKEFQSIEREIQAETRRRKEEEAM